jgi:hypothetical protein
MDSLIPILLQQSNNPTSDTGLEHDAGYFSLKMLPN